VSPVPGLPSATPCGALCIFIRDENDGRTDAEELLAFEVGYRHKIPSRNLSFDIAGFYFDYDNLITSTNPDGLVFDPSFLPDDNVLALTFINDNALEGDVYGGELSVEWKPFQNWRLSGSYSYMIADLKPKLPDVSPNEDFAINGEPKHIFSVRSYLSLPHNLEFDTMLYYVSKSELETPSTFFVQDVPSYTRLDLRLGWKPQKNFELSLVGQNLLDGQHLEHNGSLEFESETERSFYAKATFRF
jgi:iron complex outermembrane receptor protein